MNALEAAAAVGVTPEPGIPRAFASGERQELDTLRKAPLRAAPRPSRLDSSLRALRGVGPKLSEAAAELGLSTVGDLLAHAPRDYREVGAIALAGDLKLGEEGTLLVEVRSARVRPTRRRGLRIVEADAADSSGPVKALWFNQAWLAERLQPGTRVLLRGKLDRAGFRVSEHEILDRGGLAELRGDDAGSAELEDDSSRGSRAGARERTESPTDRPRSIGPGRSGVWARRPPEPPAGIHTTGLVPVHPASERLRAARIREWAWRALAFCPDSIEPLPSRLRGARGAPGAADALAAIHFPSSPQEAEKARERLALEELLLHQVALLSRRRGREERQVGVELPPRGPEVERWIGSLPFELTADQARALGELDGALGSSRPMQRLLMGEVGVGKTVVALYTMLRAVEAGYQAALMAPTETLAEQHFATLERLLADAPAPIALLTGATSAPARAATLDRLASGELGLVVGTHALIEEGVAFARLAVAVVDEQHRFGVEQRAALDARGSESTAPHTLHMTATPIPRTLSLTAYGDLDVTTLRELPAGRRPVRTWVVDEEKRAGAYDYLRGRLREGRQAFVVCPLVEESDKLRGRAATKEGERLARGELSAFDVGVLHGQMASAEKQGVMARFAAGELDVLVATSVIEVGIDVPNAAVMVVEDADRYGLSQLHQLRGRVGRSDHESACILFATAQSERARIRLEAIERERDGFKLAEVDLALRGEGEILGTRQHGMPRFQIATLPEDLGLLMVAREAVIEMLHVHGSLEAPSLGPMMEAARARFGDERSEPIAA